MTDQLKLCFARYCWTRRHQKTPSGRCTWGERFEQMHGQSLEAYAAPLIAEAQAAKQNNLKKIRETLAA